MAIDLGRRHWGHHFHGHTLALGTILSAGSAIRRFDGRLHHRDDIAFAVDRNQEAGLWRRRIGLKPR